MSSTIHDLMCRSWPAMMKCTAEARLAGAQELREMVIRGAHEHPGAVAVEDEVGRVILLHKLPLNVSRQHLLHIIAFRA